MNSPNINFLEAPRQITFDWHIVQATKWLEFDGGRMLDNSLVYAILELRFAIERYLFELLLAFHNWQLEPDDEIKYREFPAILKGLKLQAQDMSQRIEFTNLLTSTVFGGPKVALPDINFLRRRWGELSNYLHKQMRSRDHTAYLDKSLKLTGFDLVNDTIKYFRILEDSTDGVGVVNIETLDEEAKETYYQYVDGCLTKEQVRTRLIIMQPVLRARHGRGFGLIPSFGKRP